jgi:hypothetical protein
LLLDPLTDLELPVDGGPVNAIGDLWVLQDHSGLNHDQKVQKIIRNSQKKIKSNNWLKS